MTSQENLLQAIPDCAIFCKYEITHIHLISANHLEEHNTRVNITRASSPPSSFHIIFRSNKYLVGYARDAHRNACRSSLKSTVKTYRPVWKPKRQRQFFCKILWHQNTMKILSAVLEFFRATTQMGKNAHAPDDWIFGRFVGLVGVVRQQDTRLKACNGEERHKYSFQLIMGFDTRTCRLIVQVLQA